jgi:hypothetical protein
MVVTHAGTVEDVNDILSLREVKRMGLTSDKDAEKMMKRSEVFHGKFAAESVNDRMEKGSGGCCENDVIDIEKQVSDAGAAMKSEKRVIRFGFKETNGTSKGSKSLKPSPRGMFKTVE